MNQNGPCGGGGGGSSSIQENEGTTRSSFASVPTASHHQQSHHQHNQQHQQQLQPNTTMSGINASQFAAMAAAGSHPYAPVVDQHSTAAFMMSNAAATIAAVAASAVQQMNQANAAKAPSPPGTSSSGVGVGTNNNTGTASTAVLSPAFYHAAFQQQQQGNHPQHQQQQVVSTSPHVALLTALANVGAGQSVSVPVQQQHQAIASPTSVPGQQQQQHQHVDVNANTNTIITSASSMLRPNAPVLSQPTSTLASPALLSDMQSWNMRQLGTNQINQELNTVSTKNNTPQQKQKLTLFSLTKLFFLFIYFRSTYYIVTSNESTGSTLCCYIALRVGTKNQKEE